MEYTVQKLGKLAGISARTLRFYDEMNILKPARINSSGYRIYGQEQVDMLQHILFYRELGMSLDQIKAVMVDPAFDGMSALKAHHEELLDKKKQLDRLIANVEKTIAAKEGNRTMSDHEKFEGFKQKLVEDNERKYGKEIRTKYGDAQVQKSNEKVLHMTKEQIDEVTRLSDELAVMLAAAFKTGDPKGEPAQKAADLHKQWLMYYWHDYSEEAHAGLARMYVDDERFTVYYDKEQPGTAAFLRDAILHYTGMGE